MELDIANYSFEYQLLEKPPHFFHPHKWLVIVTNLQNKLKFGMKFDHNHEQPPNEKIFAVFQNAQTFKDNFFIEAEVLALEQEKAPEPPKVVDAPANNPQNTDALEKDFVKIA